MRKTALNALVALVIVGSTGQTAAASEHHLRKVYRTPLIIRDTGVHIAEPIIIGTGLTTPL
jgi:hypothetical protein